MRAISRRSLLKLTGALGATVAAPLSVAERAAPHAATTRAGDAPHRYSFFTPQEAAFIQAAVARLIPRDEEWGGAIEAGVPNYMDLQLAGAWGAGERLYRSGPWRPGIPGQGYQLPFTPAELFKKALASIRAEPSGQAFERALPAQQDAFLKGLEQERRDLGGVPSNVFFDHLWQLAQEGFFSDPVYGGNRDMVSWRMIGFPGAYASYYDLVDQHGIKLDRPPMSIGEDASQHIHHDPDIPAVLVAPHVVKGDPR
jgi:gluconate 2-dehydrogenase gamma chain